MQLKTKINDKMLLEKRQQSDFVKASKSENLLYRSQIETLSDAVGILERDNEWLLNAGDSGSATQGLDMDKFRELKQEIKSKKEAKERIIA